MALVNWSGIANRKRMRRQASKILKARHHSLTNLQNSLAAN
jgi:hypothetical protein